MNKKRLNSLFATLGISTILLTTFSGCSLSQKKVSYENTILSKYECISKIKTLLQTDNLFYFDCDFSNISTLKLKNISYNLSVSGNLIYNNSNDEYYFDCNKWGEIQLIANYSIELNNNCFGFSFKTTFFEPKMNYNHNGTTGTNPVMFYNEYTFNDINSLSYSNNTFLYDYNNIILDIAVPNNFYPFDLTKARSNKCLFYKETVNRILQPIEIVTHFENSNKRPGCDKDIVLEILKNYIYQNATYKKIQ